VSKRLTAAEVQVWRSVLLLADRLRFRVSQEVRPVTGLSPAEHSVLIHLHDAPGNELGQQALANIMFWSKSRLSHQLTRMQTRGLVRRRPDQATAGMRISLTAAGRKAVEAAADTHADAVRRFLLAKATPEELDVVVRLAERLAVDEPKD
jgi:DNA-binding MarR family transcriptional regulator